jgi:mannosyltransferase OCH1-like enzyme
LNNTWEHETWDEDSIREECEKFSPEALAKFDGYTRMMAKIVFGRYILLYNYGGISIDCDAECLRPLDKIPGINTEKLIISKSPFEFEDSVSLRGLSKDLIMFNCATIACEKEHPLMKSFIEFLIENESWDSDPQFEEQIQTGPLITSIFFNNFIDDIFILETEIIEPLGSVTKRTVLNHKYEFSWVNPFVSCFKTPYLFIRKHLTIILLFLIGLLCTILVMVLQKRV